MSPDEMRYAFRRRYGRDPELISIGPGRINLIGEHTDYNEGFVFPAAIDRITMVAAAKSHDLTELYSMQSQEGESFDATKVGPGEVSNWSKYPAGVAWALRQRGFAAVNMTAIVDSTIPRGSGVSSSAALELAFLVLQREFGGFSADGKVLAELGRLSENEFVGVNSGIMDQMASAMGKKDAALFLDTRSLDIQYAPIPQGIHIVLCDTKKERSLSDSAYNERRAQCESASKKMHLRALRDATLESLEKAKDELTEVEFRRARHVITEDDRAQEFRLALEEGDRARIGSLMRKSHESLRDDYEVSCRELDVMAAAAWGTSGCVGARMMGAGFGGACIALVESDQVEDFTKQVLKIYHERSGIEGNVMACTAGDGARIAT